MCDGVPIFANNKKAIYGKKTGSHSTAAKTLKINEDQWRKFEFHWWDGTLPMDHYDETAHSIIQSIDPAKATLHAKKLVDTHFRTKRQIAAWLKDVPEQWNRLMVPEMKSLARMVNPKLVIYQDKIAKIKKQKIEKYNPYQATKLPTLKTLKSKLPAQVRSQVWDQVRSQVWDQVRSQVRSQVGSQVWDQVWDQVRSQVGSQVWDQVGSQVWDQVGSQVWSQVWDQVWATSYWAVKVILGLPIKHWFFDFLKLGVMVVFVQGKVKVFGKKGKYLGEYDQEDFT